MALKNQYVEDVKQIRQERIKRIIEAAKIEFEKNGIINTKISTIAKSSHVGEATIYRYFTDKIQLIKSVAYDYWEEQTTVFDEYLEKTIDKDSTGLSKIKVYLEMFIELYHNHKNLLKFMEDFDNIYILSKTSEEENEFFKYVHYIKKVFLGFFNEGIDDGSINPDFDKNIAYSFISQVMVSTTQKMALRLGYNHTDNNEYAVACLNSTIDMFLQYITNNKAN